MLIAVIIFYYCYYIKKKERKKDSFSYVGVINKYEQFCIPFTWNSLLFVILLNYKFEAVSERKIQRLTLIREQLRFL